MTLNGLLRSGGQSEDEKGSTLQEDDVEALRQSNFGFKNLEILEGNIGYVRFDYFPDPEQSFEAGATAMRFVENASAVIFDMRYNRGGHNQFSQFLSSYLFDTATHQLLHEYAYMDDGEMISGEYWTIPALPGSRMPDVPVYVLTSTMTFSAGEWFTYALQKLDRAEIVGLTTSGASHAVDRKPVDDRFLLQVPIGLGRDPVDKGDFEGVGVVPDHEVASLKARDIAHKLALKELSAQSEENSLEYEWILPVLDARLSPPEISTSILEGYAGAYEGRSIEYDGERLTYHWRDRFSLALTPLQENLFAVEGVDDFRFRFAANNGSITALERIEKDGRVTSYHRR